MQIKRQYLTKLAKTTITLHGSTNMLVGLINRACEEKIYHFPHELIKPAMRADTNMTLQSRNNRLCDVLWEC